MSRHIDPRLSATASFCSGLVLAAGEGIRFGDQPKLLADLNGRPLLEHAIRAQCEVPEVGRIVVVLGAHAERLMATVRFGRAEPVFCEHWCDGQAASLRCGLAALGTPRKVIVTLGDEPLLTGAVVARFLYEPPGARAVYHGHPGHPVVLGRKQIRAIAQLSGDTGARSLLGGGTFVECSDLASGHDVDTLHDLETVRREAREPRYPTLW